MRKLHTEREEAARLNLAAKTLANQRCRGDGPPFLKLGRLIRYPHNARWSRSQRR